MNWLQLHWYYLPAVGIMLGLIVVIIMKLKLLRIKWGPFCVELFFDVRRRRR